MSNLKVFVWAVIGLIVVALGFKTCTNMVPIEIPDFQARYTADSTRLAEKYSRDSMQIANDLHRAQAEADSQASRADYWQRRSLSARPNRPPSGGIPPTSGTIPPDSGTQTKPTDSLSSVYAQNDSLWSALDAADSAYANISIAFQSQREATAAALSGWAAADSNAARQALIAGRAIHQLTAALHKVQRGCRVLGLLPCPTITAGYGAMLVNGQVRVGPTVGVSIPLKF